MKSILFIHQSSELYGSDKTLLTLVISLKGKNYLPIVILPNEGPLKIVLENAGIKVFILPVIKISRKMFSPINLIMLPFQAIKSFVALKNLSKKFEIDLVYSNTLAVLIGFLFAKITNKKHIWHIHEIIEKPKIVSKIFSLLISSKINTILIFNSFATQLFWKNICMKSFGANQVVWNGIENPNPSTQKLNVNQLRMHYWGSKEGDVVIGLVGRINKWKGHKLLLEAFYEISKKYQNVFLVFVGSCPPGQDDILLEIEQAIAQFKLGEKVTIMPFQKDVWGIWASIDIAVVPSTEPEPFGLVAIEAMLSYKPVIAAKHGGLAEIVLPNDTGILFEPNNVQSLTASLEALIIDESKRKSMGLRGHERAEKYFSSIAYVEKIESIINEI
jgi:glycosyltransferase involved in cell wall biosynthesis